MMSTLKAQIEAITMAEIQTVESINSMRARGVSNEVVDYWHGVCINLAAARETLHLLMAEREARQALAAHLGG